MQARLARIAPYAPYIDGITGLRVLCAFVFYNDLRPPLLTVAEYLLLVNYARSACWRDPTSKFYRDKTAHAPAYSTRRIKQAVEYADVIGTQPFTKQLKPVTPKICVGVSSVARNGASYLKSTLGSMQHGLTDMERESLHFIVLLAHTNQTQHPNYNDTWLASMADALPFYKDLQQLEVAEQMESIKSHWLKSKFDYSLVMSECKKTKAPYILMIEDDVVFLDGWFHRTIDALEIATAKSENMKKDRRFHPTFLSVFNSC